jgi:hypothetical protein
VALFMIKNFLYYMIPVCYITVIILFVLPFLGDGPLYPYVLNDFFLNSCSQYWWTNVLLISNYLPWNTADMCGSHIALVSNEFQLILILIPILGYIYKKYFRKVLWGLFLSIGIGASLVPVVYMTYTYNIDGFPGFLSNSYNNMMTKIYYRIPPFLIGISLSIFHFEYKYVDKLNDGSKPFLKDYLEKFTQKSALFKTICYLVGFACTAAPVALLAWNASCMNGDKVSQDVFILADDVKFCWGNFGSSLYYALSPFFFYAGISLILLPCMVGISTVVKPLLNSHLWHIMEELTF